MACEAAILVLFNDAEEQGKEVVIVRRHLRGLWSERQRPQADTAEPGVRQAARPDQVSQGSRCQRNRYLYGEQGLHGPQVQGEDQSGAAVGDQGGKQGDPRARVAADRQFETQAAIVRILKSRKKMTHAQLVAEVINQTKSRGAIEPQQIKQNIEK